MRAVIFLLMAGLGMAGSIAISVSDNPIFAVTPIYPPAGEAASACVTPYGGAQNCVTGVAPANSSITPNGASNSTASSQPAPISVGGDLSGSLPGSESSTATYGSTAVNYNTLSILPTVNVDFDPSGALASAQVVASQDANDVGAENASVRLFMALAGTSEGDFTLGPGTMSLTVTSGDSGQIIVSYRGSFCIGCGPGGSSSYSGTLIDYEFANGVVTASTNALGLALPSVGSAASFSASPSGAFSYTFPNNFGAGFLGFSGSLSDTVSQSASLVAPEPSSFAMTLGLLAVLIGCASRYTRTNASLSGSRLPSGSRAFRKNI